LKIKSKQSKTKKQLYSDLLGYRFLLEESVERLYDTHIFLKAYEEKFNRALEEQKLNEADRIHLNLNILSMLRTHQEYETARRNLANNKNDITRKIGSIQTLFPDDKKLDSLISLLYIGWSTKSSIPGIPDNPSNDQINSWSEDAMRHITKFIEDNYMAPLTNLLNYLKAEIQRESMNEISGDENQTDNESLGTQQTK